MKDKGLHRARLETQEPGAFQSRLFLHLSYKKIRGAWMRLDAEAGVERNANRWRQRGQGWILQNLMKITAFVI